MEDYNLYKSVHPSFLICGYFFCRPQRPVGRQNLYFYITMTLKQKIFSHYQQLINEKINSLHQVLSDLKESGSNETKSTAGDKHETALAMLQIEQANVRAQLKEALDQKTVFERIDPAASASIIVHGSLIKTNRGWLFLSVAAGKAIIDGTAVIALSPQSPLGIKLMGLKMGESAEVNNTRYVIEVVA
jgi:transcription elongation GreA/GreB family factor